MSVPPTNAPRSNGSIAQRMMERVLMISRKQWVSKPWSGADRGIYRQNVAFRFPKSSPVGYIASVASLTVGRSFLPSPG